MTLVLAFIFTVGDFKYIATVGVLVLELLVKFYHPGKGVWGIVTKLLGFRKC